MSMFKEPDEFRKNVRKPKPGAFGRFDEEQEPSPEDEKEVFRLSGRTFLDLPDLVVEPTSNLLGDRWLTRDGSGFIISPSGHGKSSASIKAGICWAIGRICFGIKPDRSLRILLIQCEDDDADSKKFAQIIRKMKLTAEERELLGANTRFEFRRDITGDRFISALDAFLTEFPVDLVIINPLSGFLLCDMSDTAKVSDFLRNKLNALMVKHRCAALIFHHTPKTNFTKLDNMEWYDWMYALQGCASLTNWARAVLVIAPSKLPGTYRFIAAKRFDEIQWTERQYWFSHSREKMTIDGKEYVIYDWLPSTEAQIAAAKPTPKGQKESLTAEQIWEKMSPLEWHTKTQFREWAHEKFHIGMNNADEKLKLLEEMKLVEVSEERRPGTNPLKRYRKTGKPSSTNGSETYEDN
jgi:hypothetical protein